MKLKEFIKQGYSVQVDVPVVETREFDIEGFINNTDDGAWDYDGDSVASSDWERHYEARRYTILDPYNDIVKANIEEEDLEEVIENM